MQRWPNSVLPSSGPLQPLSAIDHKYDRHIMPVILMVNCTQGLKWLKRFMRSQLVIDATTQKICDVIDVTKYFQRIFIFTFAVETKKITTVQNGKINFDVINIRNFSKDSSVIIKIFLPQWPTPCHLKHFPLSSMYACMPISDFRRSLIALHQR